MKSQKIPNSDNIRIKPELNIIESNLPPNLKIYEQQLLSDLGFCILNWFSTTITQS